MRLFPKKRKIAQLDTIYDTFYATKHGEKKLKYKYYGSWTDEERKDDANYYKSDEVVIKHIGGQVYLVGTWNPKPGDAYEYSPRKANTWQLIFPTAIKRVIYEQ